jgi:uncharacterized repeat protein (TIGR01451 family)
LKGIIPIPSWRDVNPSLFDYLEYKPLIALADIAREKIVTIRVLILYLGVLLALAACASGSGRQGTEIVVTGTGPTSQVAGGQNAVFVMTVTNAGPYDASNVKLIDNVGNQLKLLSITCAASGGATCPSSPSVEMVISEIPNGGVLKFSVTTQLDSGATGTVENSMVASFANEIDPTQDSAAVTATASSSAVNDVVVSGTGPSGTVVGGSSIVFVMKVTNSGTQATGAFNVYDNVGSGLTLTQITCSAAGGAVCPDSVGVLTAIPSLAAGGVLTFNVTTAVGQNVNGTVSNEMVVNVPGNTGTSTFYATATVVTADISVTGTAPSGPLLAGQSGVFIMVVTNNGPAVAQDLTITNTLSATVTASGPITCSATVGSVCPSTLGPSMTLASLPVGGALTFDIPFTVLANSGSLTDMMSVASTTDPHSPRTATVGVGATGSTLIVTETGAEYFTGGGNVVFTALVQNTGPSAASNVTVGYTLSGPLGTVAAVTCSAPATVACPTTLGPSMTIPTLGVGRGVTFTFTVPVPQTNPPPSGTVTNVVTANASGNTDLTNNTATAAVTLADSHNGTYQVFAANGFQYTMDLDIDQSTGTGSYTLTAGNGQTYSESFASDGNGGYVVSGAMRLRLATNVVVGGQDFGSGVIVPYFAARVFGTTIQQLSSTPGPLYDLVTYSNVGNGMATTVAGTARVSGNSISICQSDTQVAIPQNCAAANLSSYTLTVTGNQYTGTNTLNGAGFPFQTFQLALIGATDALIWAGPDIDGTPQLIIGLPDASVLAGGTTEGPTTAGAASATTGDWVLNMTLTPQLYEATYLISGNTVNAPLSRISQNSAPFSMLVGELSSPQSGEIYVMESVPISIAFGAYGGPQTGLLQITVP